jgi:hypothetical protein
LNEKNIRSVNYFKRNKVCRGKFNSLRNEIWEWGRIFCFISFRLCRFFFVQFSVQCSVLLFIFRFVDLLGTNKTKFAGFCFYFNTLQKCIKCWMSSRYRLVIAHVVWVLCKHQLKSHKTSIKSRIWNSNSLLFSPFKKHTNIHIIYKYGWFMLEGKNK